MSDAHLPSPERGPSRRAIELAAAAVLIVLSALVLWDSYDRGAGWSDGPQSGFFPARIGWVLLIASAIALALGARRAGGVFVTWSQLRQVARVFLPLLLFTVAIELIGIYAASALFMALFMVTLGSFRWWSVVLWSLLVPIVTFWVFEIQFRVPLPKGPIESMFGY